ncbi:MAG: hypothetical protein GY769_24165 [bacterium]|nr:hypothetical protein [bacterium]
MSSQWNEQLDRELSLKGLIIFAVGLTVVVVAMAALMWVLAGTLKGRLADQDPPRPKLPAARTQPLPPEPRLQAEPEEDLRLMREEEEHLLSTFDWVDQASGVARVPVATAIDLLAEESRPGSEEAP